MGPSRLEVNLRRLLGQCELFAKEDSETNWRLEKFIGYLDEMIHDLQRMPNKPARDVIAEYIRRTEFLKGIIHTRKLSTPEEKVVAVQLLRPGPSSADNITREIHQQTISKYTEELREELFTRESNKGDALRQRKPSKQSSGEDLDIILKYHHAMQEKIAEDMLSVARNLKEQTQLANSIILKDTDVVEKSSGISDSNFERLKVESGRLEEHNRKGCRCWMWIMIALVIIIFINMVILMKVKKKKE